MLKRKVINSLLGVSTVAALCAALSVQAQSSAGQGTSGQSTSGQTAGQSTSGQGSGQSSSGQSSSGQGMAGQGSSTQGSSGHSASGHASGGQSSTSQAGSGQAMGQSAGQGSTASGSGAGSVSKADQKILTNLAMANMAEVEAGRMAQSKSQSEQVKTFAQQMIDDHTKAMSEVQQLAQSKGITLPTQLDRQHKAKADKLASLSGEQFDKAYMAQAGVADHKKNHGMLQQAQSRAKDPDIKALAARLAPTVDQHLSSAQQLHGNKSTARGSSGNANEKSGQ